MKSIEVKGTARTIAERSSEQARALKAIRKDNGVPCVLYGGSENIHFTVSADGLRNLVYTPHIYVVDLIIDGKKINAIMKDIQFHPVKDTILHVDFYQIDESKPIVMEVPVQMEGLAEGVKAGGKLVLQMRKLKVKALYNSFFCIHQFQTFEVQLTNFNSLTQTQVSNIYCQFFRNNVV